MNHKFLGKSNHYAYRIKMNGRKASRNKDTYVVNFSTFERRQNIIY